MSLTLLGMCGSLRAASINRKLMHEAARAFGDATFVEANLNLPLYDGDLEDQGMPVPVSALIEQVRAADAVVLVTPEYNQSLSGVMKNALDWISRGEGKPWLDKPVALMSATAGRAGGARAQYALRLCMMPFRAHVLPGPEVMIGGASKEFDADGRLTGERYRKDLSTLMTDLRAVAAR